MDDMLRRSTVEGTVLQSEGVKQGIAAALYHGITVLQLLHAKFYLTTQHCGHLSYKMCFVLWLIRSSIRVS